MQFRLFSPPDDLKGLVKNFYAVTNSSGERLPKEYKAMADGCPEIVFQLDGGFYEYSELKVYLRAQRSIASTLTVKDTLQFFGIRLYPHAIQKLFNMPSTEIINRIIDLKILVKDRTSLMEQIASALTNERRVDLACAFVRQLENSKTPDPMHKLVRYVMQGEGLVDLVALRNEFNLSERQLERRFKAIAGFSPKHFARMMRFQSTKRRYASGHYCTLAALAYASNYSDQSHFIHEFKEFSGMNPSHYFGLLDLHDSDEAKVLKHLLIAKEAPVISSVG